MYKTRDLYIAAALKMSSGVSPRLNLPANEVIAECVWDDETPVKGHLAKLQAGTLLVDPRRFRCAHIELKKQVRAIVDKKGS